MADGQSAVNETVKMEAPADQILGTQAYTTNLKRIVDDYALMAQTSHVNAAQETERLRNAAFMALMNAVETANMVAKQAIRHADSVVYNTDNPVVVGAGNAEDLRAVDQKSTT